MSFNAALVNAGDGGTSQSEAVKLEDVIRMISGSASTQLTNALQGPQYAQVTGAHTAVSFPAQPTQVRLLTAPSQIQLCTQPALQTAQSLVTVQCPTSTIQQTSSAQQTVLAQQLPICVQNSPSVTQTVILPPNSVQYNTVLASHLQSSPSNNQQLSTDSKVAIKGWDGTQSPYFNNLAEAGNSLEKSVQENCGSFVSNNVALPQGAEARNKLDKSVLANCASFVPNVVSLPQGTVSTPLSDNNSVSKNLHITYAGSTQKYMSKGKEVSKEVLQYIQNEFKNQTINYNQLEAQPRVIPGASNSMEQQPSSIHLHESIRQVKNISNLNPQQIIYTSNNSFQAKDIPSPVAATSQPLNVYQGPAENPQSNQQLENVANGKGNIRNAVGKPVFLTDQVAQIRLPNNRSAGIRVVQGTNAIVQNQRTIAANQNSPTMQIELKNQKLLQYITTTSQEKLHQEYLNLKTVNKAVPQLQHTQDQKFVRKRVQKKTVAAIVGTIDVRRSPQFLQQNSSTLVPTTTFPQHLIPSNVPVGFQSVKIIHPEGYSSVSGRNQAAVATGPSNAAAMPDSMAVIKTSQAASTLAVSQNAMMTNPIESPPSTPLGKCTNQSLINSSRDAPKSSSFSVYLVDNVTEVTNNLRRLQAGTDLIVRRVDGAALPAVWNGEAITLKSKICTMQAMPMPAQSKVSQQSGGDQQVHSAHRNLGRPIHGNQPSSSNETGNALPDTEHTVTVVKKEVKRKQLIAFEQGKYIVCHHCGLQSANYVNCEGCNKDLPENTKFYYDHTYVGKKPKLESEDPLTSSPEDAKVEDSMEETSSISTPAVTKQQFYGSSPSIQKVSKSPSIPRKKAPAKKKAKKLQEPEVVSIVSSDEEDPDQQQPSKQTPKKSNSAKSTPRKSKAETQPEEPLEFLENGTDITALEDSIKNKFKWEWMDIVINVKYCSKMLTYKISDSFCKIAKPGEAYCKMCNKVIKYMRGRVSVVDHCKTRTHLKKVIADYQASGVVDGKCTALLN